MTLLQPVGGPKSVGAQDITWALEKRSGAGKEALSKAILLGVEFSVSNDFGFTTYKYGEFRSQTARGDIERAAMEFCLVFGIKLTE